MDNFFEIFKSLSSLKSKENQSNIVNIPKEIQDQYPYGQFPIKYTKSGQETIRKQSENRFSYIEDESTKEDKANSSNDISQLGLILPLIQALSGQKKQPKDLMQIFGKILFKDNPELQKLFSLMPKIKTQSETIDENFPNTNKVNISSLKRID